MAGSVTLQAVFETLNWPHAGLDVHRNGERTMMHLTHYMCTRYARYPFQRRAIPRGWSTTLWVSLYVGRMTVTK